MNKQTAAHPDNGILFSATVQCFHQNPICATFPPSLPGLSKPSTSHSVNNHPPLLLVVFISVFFISLEEFEIPASGSPLWKSQSNSLATVRGGLKYKMRSPKGAAFCHTDYPASKQWNWTVWFRTCLWPMAKVIQLGRPILCVYTWKKAPHFPHHERQAFTGFCNYSYNMWPVVLFFLLFIFLF